MSANLLGNETSPYLLQHKDNPVWWMPWGDEAFARAKREDKPVFLSVGYSTCHWCHVMEKDSFEKNDVAEILNNGFVSVKVDREERPDVDSVYMNAVQVMTGGGGWPMSVLLDGEGRPFWGGTFVPHDQFIMLLNRVAELWKSDRSHIINGGHQMAEFLQANAAGPRPGGATNPQFKSLEDFYKSFESRFDTRHGGSRGAPKFPPALSLSALLRYYRRSGETQALAMVEKTLAEMRRGGMYDHVGGGFHRYSVDDHWLIPHFEKMLYDNALLPVAYLEAFQITKNSEYARTAREILDYVLRDLTAKDGGFFSAEDADSEHIEGKFYVWSEAELRSMLATEEFDALTNSFHVTSEGNFEAHVTGDEVTNKRFDEPAIKGNVFFLASGALLPAPRSPAATALEKLLAVRARRVRPLRDEKIITSWNGLMISAMCRGYRVLGDRKYLAAAGASAAFFLKQFQNNGSRLDRAYRDNTSRHGALAEDYVCLIAGLLDLYESDFDARRFKEALLFQEILDEKFWDSADGGYFESDGSDRNLLLRHKNFEDGVTPSTNSVAAANLLKFHELTGEAEYKNRALKIVERAGLFLTEHPAAVTKLLQTIDPLTSKPKEIAVAVPPGKDVDDFLKKFWSDFHPDVTIAVSKTDKNAGDIPLLKDRKPIDGKITYFLCEGQTCRLPETDSAKVLAQL